MEKYKIISINFDTAFKVWESSPNANIYNNPIFLKNYKNVTFLGAFKGDEINCCWPIFKNKKKILIPNFFYYFGPFWSKKIFLEGMENKFVKSEKLLVFHQSAKKGSISLVNKKKKWITFVGK